VDRAGERWRLRQARLVVRAGKDTSAGGHNETKSESARSIHGLFLDWLLELETDSLLPACSELTNTTMRHTISICVASDRFIGFRAARINSNFVPVVLIRKRS
jgi:hypothetical protein